MNFLALREMAYSVVRPRKLSEFAIAGSVGAALLTDLGNVYTGVCIDAACAIGFCAEHSAIAAMITAGESKIVKIVAVGKDNNIMPPCGRCRELISQLNIDNINTQVMIAEGNIMSLKELLPYDFKESCPTRYI